MWLTPLSTACRRTLMAARRSCGGPNTFGPVSRMAPKPIGATWNGPRPRHSTTCSIALLVPQLAVEVDRDVHAVAERLVFRVSATTQRHVFAMRNLPAGDVGETHRTRHQVRAVLARRDIDISHCGHTLEPEGHVAASPQGIPRVTLPRGLRRTRSRRDSSSPGCGTAATSRQWRVLPLRSGAGRARTR